ncbi:MAG TPA: hypothetical protein VFU74_11355 [Actinocrinis sp.]|nr:hypothetical protein [Actinocrinis sp.]
MPAFTALDGTYRRDKGKFQPAAPDLATERLPAAPAARPDTG